MNRLKFQTMGGGGGPFWILGMPIRKTHNLHLYVLSPVIETPPPKKRVFPNKKNNEKNYKYMNK